MYIVYILRSESTGKLYVGFTSHLDQRVGQHNHGITKSTKNRGPWLVVYSERSETRSDAMKREKFFKSGRGREEIQMLLAKAASPSSSVG
jgi:putative endonuclease